MSFSFETFKKRIELTADRIEEIGGKVQEIIIEDPATEEQILSVERELGVLLPESFKNILLNFSAAFRFRWYFPDDFKLSNQYREIFSGRADWNLNDLVEIDKGRREWIEHVFPNPEDDYDKVWHNKLAFLEVENGDYFAFDLSEAGRHPIVYLSHDDGAGHGYVIANNFIELIDNWSRICFVGSEDWQWMPFVQSSESGILPCSDSAIEFRKLLKIDI